MLPSGSKASSLSVNSRSIATTHTAADLEVLEEIEDIYFSNPHDIDPGRHILENMPDTADCDMIEEMFSKLKRQQQVVCGKALHLISQQRDSCDKEFEEIQDITHHVGDTLDICKEARKHLHEARNCLTVSTFAILANFRKRQIVKYVLKVLQLLKLLRDVDANVSEKLANTDYEGAIELIIKCRVITERNSEYCSVRSIATRLQDSLDMTEEKLDLVLASLCRHFDPNIFARLRNAYTLLDKLQAAMEQLHMHYTSAINEAAYEALRSYAKDVRPEMKMPEICHNIPTSQASNCLLDLCENLFFIMRSYYLLVDWHSKLDLNDESQQNSSEEYIRQKLIAGLVRIWHDVQSKVSIFLKNSGLENYPFEKFVQVLGVLRKLTQIAEVFCSDKAEVLNDFIKSNTVAYIKKYHKGRMDELRLFLENEGWEQCPVRNDFNLLQLQEFKPLKRYLKYNIDHSVRSLKATAMSDNASSVLSQDDTIYITNFFKSETDETPFEVFRCENPNTDDIFGIDTDADISSDESDAENEINEMSGNVILTNTTLSVLRNCGQYMQICRYLPAITLDVIIVMFQLFEYYLYTVHLYFTLDLRVSTTTLYSSKLNTVLKKFKNGLEGDSTIKPPSMPDHLDLNNENNLYGLSERIVAVESVIFLSKQLDIVYPYLESLVSQQQKIIVEHFRDNTLKSATDLRLPIYMGSASKCIDTNATLSNMSQVKFDIKNVVSEHDTYIDNIFRQVQIFSMRLDDVKSRVHVSDDVSRAIWAMVAKYIIHVLVEGFSNVNKCSPSGRGLMQLDYTQLVMKLEKLSGVKPLPYQDYVDKYVKAYYLPRDLLEDFIKNRSEYSYKHILALINCASTNKREKQELIAILDSRDSIQEPDLEALKSLNLNPKLVGS